MNRQQIWKAAGLVFLFCSLASAGTIITFDGPGAGTGSFQGTFALAINPSGTIAGFFLDANFVGHGYVRTADGTITPFDVPGAELFGTAASSISNEGVVTGSFFDVNFMSHGFVRTTDGTITTFDVPGDGPFGTVPSSISPEGVVTGSFFDVNFMSHGFVRATDGTITTFDDPSASTGFFDGTTPVAINAQGAIVGCFSNSLGVGVGFLRTSGGVFRTLNPAGGPDGFTTGAFCGSDIFSVVESMAINPGGEITGAYFQPIPGDPFTGNYRGFVRTLDGKFTTFDAVASPSSPCCTWTFPTAINPAGEVVGFDNDFRAVNVGFLRASNGAITLFDAPGAGTRRNQGTVAVGINPAGVITGYYVDANNVRHGFLRTP
jgi:hypothetical protein